MKKEINVQLEKTLVVDFYVSDKVIHELVVDNHDLSAAKVLIKSEINDLFGTDPAHLSHLTVKVRDENNSLITTWSNYCWRDCAEDYSHIKNKV